MPKNLFEVFLGTYNAAPWIHKIFHSLENQDAQPFTVNVIDNDSSDETLEIIKEIAENFQLKNNYQVIKNEKNIGAISTFLDQLDLFDSEWLLFIHQDDYYHSDHVSTIIQGIKNSSDSTSIIFSAMRRIDAQGNEIFTPPTLASQLSENDRLENFLLTLQISPVNFPACALRISYLKQVNTTRHTNAFNDVELLLRLMCISDVKYIQKETMHYRIYPGNASANVSEISSDRAIFVGLSELFHSNEFFEVLEIAIKQGKLKRLTLAISESIEIRFKNELYKNLIRNVLAESLVRRIGYQNKEISGFLIDSLSRFDLTLEKHLVKNLSTHKSSNLVNLNSQGKKPYKLEPIEHLQPSTSPIASLSNTFSIRTREKFFDILFRSPIKIVLTRPFAKVWRGIKNK